MTFPASQTRPWPSIERLLVSWLPDQVEVPVAAESWADYTTPDMPSSQLPLIIVDRVSGADLDYRMDRPIVDIDVFAATRGEAVDIAEQVRYALRVELPGTVFNGVVFTRTRTIVAPRSLAHGNPNVRRFTAEYELVLHLTPAA